jgi:hypothetical protein
MRFRYFILLIHVSLCKGKRPSNSSINGLISNGRKIKLNAWKEEILIFKND